MQTFEQDLPGANTAGFNTNEIGTLPLETSLTMNDSWGFNITDAQLQVGAANSSATSCAPLATTPTCCSTSGRGPTARSSLRPSSVCAPSGEWLQTYGTLDLRHARAVRSRRRRWGATTQRGDSVFVHVLDWRDRIIAIPFVGRRITRATVLGSGAAVDFDQRPDGVRLTLPDGASEPDRVIVLRVSDR